MAYEFVSGSKNSFRAVNGISSIDPPFTLFTQLRVTNVNAGRSIVDVYTDGSTDNYHGLRHLATQNIQATSRSNVNGTATVSFSAIGLTTWFAGTGVFSATNSRTVYANTTSVTNTTNITGVTFDSLSIGGGISGAGQNLFSGQLAECAIWDVALTSDEIASLTQGFKPFRIRPQSLLYYVPLVRDVHELRSGIALTTSANAPTVFSHPRVY